MSDPLERQSDRLEESAVGSSSTSELPAGFDRRASSRARPYKLLDTPAPVKQLFARFPLCTLPAESRPASSIPLSLSQDTSRNSPNAPRTSLQLGLWLRSTSEDPRMPSFDLESLKWQTYITGRGLTFNIFRAQPDASPDGRLPFMIATPLPSSAKPIRVGSKKNGSSGAKPTVIRRGELAFFTKLREKNKRSEGITAAKEEAQSQEQAQEDAEREQLGHAIIEQQVRPAWLWALYLTSSNFASIAKGLYIDSVTRSPIARRTLEWQLKEEITRELSRWISASELAVARTSSQAALKLGEELNRRAGRALDELARLLGGWRYFSGEDRPGLLDAELFAYTHLLTAYGSDGTDSRLEWVDARLADEFRARDKVVKHHHMVLAQCFDGEQMSGSPLIPSTDDLLVYGTPVDVTPIDVTPVDVTPVDVMPADDTPASDVPAYDMPAYDAPAAAPSFESSLFN